eukprot:6284160-Lingulodinium_polyedra.AAC.1
MEALRAEAWWIEAKQAAGVGTAALPHKGLLLDIIEMRAEHVKVQHQWRRARTTRHSRSAAVILDTGLVDRNDERAVTQTAVSDCSDRH